MIEELNQRRENLFQLMKEGSVAIIYAGKAKISSEDEYYPFLANRNFFYLTNIEQENSVLILIKGIGENKVYLFVDEYNPLKEKWTGKRLTTEEASEISGIKNVYTNNNFDSIFSLATAKDNNTYGKITTLYMDLSEELKINDSLSTREVCKYFKEEYSHLEIENIYPLLVSLRMVKSPYEVECIKEAINLTNTGLNDLIINLKVGMHEYSLSDRFEYYGRIHNRAPISFSSIAAAGKNATILHHPYSQQDALIEQNDLVLLDLGFKHKGYAADITRTYPVMGEYDEKQRMIYEAVLNCNKAVIEYAKEGLTLKDLQDYAIEILTKECLAKGLITPDDDIKKYYYHNVSHHLGLDTHDVADRSLPLVKGNVITVEPGLYFADLGIGVRIEDDILITEGKAEVLSKDIKKEIAEIERMFKSKANL